MLTLLSKKHRAIVLLLAIMLPLTIQFVHDTFDSEHHRCKHPDCQVIDIKILPELETATIDDFCFIAHYEFVASFLNQQITPELKLDNKFLIFHPFLKNSIQLKASVFLPNRAPPVI